MIAILKKRLRDIGFTQLSRDVVWCSGGQLIHVVSFGKDPHGRVMVCPIVWHSSLLSQSEKLAKGSIQSPVSGNVSPSGVDQNWVWEDGELDAEFAVRVLTKFFGHFGTLDDVRRSLEGRHVWPRFQEVLSQDFTRPEIDALVQSKALYAVGGGALTAYEAGSRYSEFLRRLLTPLGFSLVKSSDVIAVRRRGELHECVRILIDSFATFASITCFPWSTDIWRADKRWKGTYYPMIRFDLCNEQGRILFELEELETFDLDQLRSEVELTVDAFSSLKTSSDFVSALGPQWANIASSVRSMG